MTNVTVALVRDLREKTGVGMMDCKRALKESDGNFDAALDWLRKKGMATAQKKAERTAAEGLVGIYANGLRADIVEVNAETDFVGRNDIFRNFVDQVAKLAGANDGDLEQLKASIIPDSNKRIDETLNELIGQIGENMHLRRTAKLQVSQGTIGHYIHAQQTPTTGRIGVLVGLQSSGDTNILADLARNIAMHIAAARPQYLCVDEVDNATLEREKSVLADQARASGKPEAIIEKMVEGRLRKFYEEVVLNEQIFVMDGENKISKVIVDAAKKLGTEVELTGFIRFELGEGVQKDEHDFAAEVQAASAN